MEITKSIAETYVIRPDQGWGIITLNESTGTVDCQSDYGDYSYRWASIGKQTLKQFISNINFDYAMGKFIGRGDEFQTETTKLRIKQDIIEYRKITELSKESARNMWDEISGIGYCSSGEEFYRELDDTEIHKQWPEFYEYFVKDFSFQAYGFWVYLWMPFIEYLKNGET